MTNETIHLIGGYLDDELTDTQFDQLVAWLREDDAHLDALARLSLMHHQISEQMRQDDIASMLTLDHLNRSGTEPDQAEAEADDTYLSALMYLKQIEDQAPDAAPVNLTDEMARRRKVRRQATESVTLPGPAQASVDEHATAPRVIVIPAPLFYGGLAAAITLVAVVIWSSLRSSVEMPTTVVRARLVEQIGAQWEGASTLLEAGDVIGDEPLTLSRGFARLRLANGVEIVLEAPARIELASLERMTLSYGKLVGLVPKGAEGFTVQAPGVVVEDLGTEFAIDSEAGLGSHVHVLSGRVKLRPPVELPPRHAFAETELVAGAARSAQARGGDLQIIPSRPEAFTRRVPSPYELALRTSNPLHWWSFNVEEDQAVIDRGRLTMHALEVSRDRVGPGVYGQAFRIRNQGAPLVFSEHHAMTTTSDFTIEAWVRIDDVGPSGGRFLSNVPPHRSHAARTDGFILGVAGETLAASRMWDEAGEPVQASPYSLKFTFAGVIDVYTERPLPRGRWVHIAAAVDADNSIRLYIDGERQRCGTPSIHREALLNRHPGKSSSAPLAVGQEVDHPDGVFTGFIDELVIYDRALNAQEIAHNAQQAIAGQRQPTP